MKLHQLLFTILALCLATSLCLAQWQEILRNEQNSKYWPEREADYRGDPGYKSESFAFDLRRNVAVLWKGGVLHEWDGHMWRKPDASGPSHFYVNNLNGNKLESLEHPRIAPALIYQEKLGLTILHGGNTWFTVADDPDIKYLADLWTWDGNTWNLKIENGIYSKPNSAYMASNDLVTVFYAGGTSSDSGTNAAMLADYQWRFVHYRNPPPRIAFAVAYDPRRKVAVLYGGAGLLPDETDHYPLFADTWEWDGKRWRQREATDPGQRAGYSLTYFPPLKGFLLFGGYSRYPVGHNAKVRSHNDLWLWDGIAWSEVTVKGKKPPIRYGHGAAFDPEKKALVIFGGERSKRDYNDLWYYKPAQK